MNFKKVLIIFALVLFIFGFIFTSCQKKTTAVGIVLPTKDEPRWIQDQTRFLDALKNAGFSAKVLFS